MDEFINPQMLIARAIRDKDIPMLGIIEQYLKNAVFHDSFDEEAERVQKILLEVIDDFRNAMEK